MQYHGRFGWGQGVTDYGAVHGPMGCELLVDGVVTHEKVDFVDTQKGVYRVLVERNGEIQLTPAGDDVVRDERTGELILRLKDDSEGMPMRGTDT